VLCATSTSAQHLDEARALYEAAALTDAAGAFEAALRSGELGPEEVAAARWHLAVLAAMTGDDVRARDEFVLAHALDPSLAAPAELPPDRRVAFEGVSPAPLEVQATRRVEGDRVHVRVVFDNAPRALVARYRTERDGDERMRGDSFEVARAGFAGEDLVLEVEGLDSFGNVVVRREVVVPVPNEWRALATPPEVAADPPSRRGLKIGLGVTAVLLVGGAVATAIALSRRDSSVSFGAPSFERE